MNQKSESQKIIMKMQKKYSTLIDSNKIKNLPFYEKRQDLKTESKNYRKTMNQNSLDILIPLTNRTHTANNIFKSKLSTPSELNCKKSDFVSKPRLSFLTIEANNKIKSNYFSLSKRSFSIKNTNNEKEIQPILSEADFSILNDRIFSNRNKLPPIKKINSRDLI